jgi:hypothetical protein
MPMTVGSLIGTAHADVSQSTMVHKIGLMSGYGNVMNCWLLVSFGNILLMKTYALHCLE